jgi:hypothetical protein
MKGNVSIMKIKFSASRLIPALAGTLLALPVLAQTPTPTPTLDALIASHGSVSVGDLTFSNFQKPSVLPVTSVGLLRDFNDIAVNTTATADGSRVGLVFTAIDPGTGAPRPLVVGANAGAEVVRLISYNVTVTNPALLLHSVDQSFGPGTSIPSNANTEAMNFLVGLEPVTPVFDLLLSDQLLGGNALTRGATFPSAPEGGFLLPGGNLAGYALENEFGIITGHGGVFTSGTLDSVSVIFSLVPAGAPVPPAVVNLLAFSIDPTGIGGVSLTDFAQAGGATITLASSNPAAFAVPATVTVPQSARVFSFAVGPPNVDVPTPVTVTASFNGVTLSQTVTVNPTVTLALATFQAAATPATATARATAQLLFDLNRVNVTPAVILTGSSNPAVAPVPASFTIPAFTNIGDFRFSSLTIPLQSVGVDTPVTFSASFGGVTLTQTVTVPKTVDTVKITKAELVVKNLNLKVEATSTSPAATLTLFNAATGQLIGTMTSSGAGRYSFQGNVSPVQTLLLRSSMNGVTTGAVAQK